MSTLKNAALLSLASICVASSGCVSRQSLVTDASPTALTSYDANYTETAYRAVQYMLWNARDEIVGEDAFDSSRPVLCAVAVDLNDMNKTTNFGRLMGQSLKTALQAQRSNKIIEVDLRQAYMPIVQGENAGEFLLSRNLLTLAPRFNAGAALVSTYSIALNKVYVTVELINVDQNVIVAAHQFEVPIGPRTWALLTNKELPPEADSILQYRPPQSASGQMEKPWPFANPS
ncbi:MAG: FlgO family outer membrane protein [Planctomycetota bacterium]